ncbi:MAG: DnaB-like helicase C-terminal domain-containing protein [Pleurocapsa sp. MO_192.B19]|nr:DnaB-like helicase C-terminal domain-containing protein [Pleurocapsa sp. MO_192.B19]
MKLLKLHTVETLTLLGFDWARIIASIKIFVRNGGVEGQSNKRPSMSDIKDSGDIEQDMDLGLLLYRDEYYNSDTNDKGIMEVIVGKNRNGSTGTCKVMFNPNIGKFSNLGNNANSY